MSVDGRDAVAAGAAVLAALQSAAPGGDQGEQVASAAAMLRGAPATFHWAEVALFLVHHDRAAHLRRVVSWLRAHADEPAVAFVLGDCLRHAADDTDDTDDAGADDDRAAPHAVIAEVIAEVARRWCARNHRTSHANYVLEPLLALVPPDPDLERWAEDWLGVGAGDPRALVRLLVERYGRTDLGLRWLRAHPTSHPSWSWVLDAVFRQLAGQNTVGTEATPGPGRPDGPDGPDAAELDEVGRAALDWLREQPGDHGPWTYVWEATWAVGVHRREVAGIGLRWLERHPGHGSWSHLFERLWTLDDLRPRLRVLGLSWLDCQPRPRGWLYVWEILWGTGVDGEVLCALALRWLADGPATLAWPRVWRRLWEAGGDRQALTDAAIAQLRGHPRNLTTVDIWLDLWKTGERTPELAALGVRCVTVHTEHPRWTNAWLAVWAAGDRSVADLGLAWLTRLSPARNWSHVWDELWAAGHHRDTLARTAVAWLERNTLERHGWHFVWRTLRGGAARAAVDPDAGTDADAGAGVSVGVGVERLDAVAVARLAADLARLQAPHVAARWVRVWNDLCDADDADLPGLCDLALRWLGGTPVNHRWQTVARMVAEHRPDRLHATAASRLDGLPPDHPQWGAVWHVAWTYAPDRDRLRAPALAWLRDGTEPPTPPTWWSRVWRRLWEAGADAEALRQLGLARLRAGLTGRDWQDVWRPLWRDGWRHAELTALARDWLASTPDTEPGWYEIQADLSAPDSTTSTTTTAAAEPTDSP